MVLNKKIAAMGITALMVALPLAGCGSSNDKAENTPAANTNATTNATTNEAANAGTGNQPAETGTKLTGDFEIQYFVGGYGDKWWKKVIADFQAANPDLKIKESAGPKINEQMKPRWIAGNPPDFVYIDGPELFDRQMVTDGQLEDLTDWIKDAKNIDGDKIIDLLAQRPQQFDGKIYNIPFVMSSWGIFYDKALFKEKGWAEPKDFEEFLAVSEKIKGAGINPFIHTGKYPYYINGGVLLPAIVSANNNDYKLLQDMSTNNLEAWKNPAIIKGLNKIVQMRDKGLHRQSIRTNQPHGFPILVPAAQRCIHPERSMAAKRNGQRRSSRL